MLVCFHAASVPVLTCPTTAVTVTYPCGATSTTSTTGALNVGVTGGTGNVNIVTTAGGATFTNANPTIGTFLTSSTFYQVTATPDQGGAPCTYIVLLSSGKQYFYLLRVCTYMYSLYVHWMSLTIIIKSIKMKSIADDRSNISQSV